ncbi:MAG: hypothetical protein ABI461_16565 [Polyangiaceae bacterium]
MRKIYLLLGVIGLTAMGGTFAACSSDDSVAGDDTTADSGQPDTYVAPTDSGPKADGSTPIPDAGPCVKCKELITGKGSLSNACPSSVTLALSAIACVCNTGATGSPGEGKCDKDSGTMSADGGAGACGTFCASPTSTLPDNSCIGCGATQCTSEFTACEEDTNEPPPADAGADAADAADGA